MLAQLCDCTDPTESDTWPEGTPGDGNRTCVTLLLLKMEVQGLLPRFQEIRTVKQLTLWDTANPRLRSSLTSRGAPDSVRHPRQGWRLPSPEALARDFSI